MRQLPDIVTSAGFWASIATMWSAAGAWFTFVGAAKESRDQTYRGISNLLLGIEAELSLIEGWAHPYPQGDSDQVLALKHPDWFNPSRQVFTFDTPTLSGLTNSPYLRYLAPVMPDVVILNHSIRKLFDFLDIYKSFVFGDAELYGEVFVPVSQGKRPLGRGGVFVNVVFGMNKTIHQELIGGPDSTNQDCLHKSFIRTKTALSVFKQSLRPEQLPRWYWILHFVATFLALNGLWQVARWFRPMFCP